MKCCKGTVSNSYVKTWEKHQTFCVGANLFWQNLFSLPRIPPEISQPDRIGAGLNIFACLTGIHRTLKFLLPNEQIYEFRKPHVFQASLPPDSTPMRGPLLRMWFSLTPDLGMSMCLPAFELDSCIPIEDKRHLLNETEGVIHWFWVGRTASPGFTERNNWLSTN